MQANFKPAIKQQGFTLLLVLLALLVLGGVVITAIDITGSKQREAASQVSKASLDAAIQAAYNYTREVLVSANGTSNNQSQLCESAFTTVENAAKTTHVFLDNENAGQKISWKIDSINKNCTSLEETLKINIKAWQGAEAKPMSVSYAVARVGLDEEVGSGVTEALKGLLGDRAITTGGKISLEGDAKVTGSTLSNELNFTGSSQIIGMNAPGYSNTAEYNKVTHNGGAMPNWFNGFGNGMEAVDRTQQEDSEPLPDDPLGLMAALNNLYHIDSKGTKRDLNWLKSQTPALPSGGGLTTNVFLTPTKMERRGKLLGLPRLIETTKFFKPVNFFDKDVPMGFTRGLALTSNNGMFVEGGDVYLYINGNLTFGGGSSLTIDDDSSLTVVVTGDVTIYGGFLYKFDKSYNTKGEPIFSILATNEKKSWSDVFGYESVRLMNSAKHRGLIYSLSDIRLTGDAEIKGQVYAKNISVKNSSRIIYEEVDLPTGSGSGQGESSGTNSTYTLKFNRPEFL